MIGGSMISFLVALGAAAGLLAVVFMVRAARDPRGTVPDPDPVPISYLQVALGREQSVRQAPVDQGHANGHRDGLPSGLVRTPSPTSLGGRLAGVSVEPRAEEPTPVIDLRDTDPVEGARSDCRHQPYQPDPALLAHLDDLLAEASFAHYDRMRPRCESRVVDTRDPVGHDLLNGAERA